MLADLSGRTHRVLTAVAVGRGARPARRLLVSFDTLTPTQIRRYVGRRAHGQGRRHAIRGHAGLWVSASPAATGIVGLPAFETAGLLRAAGLPIL